MVTLTSPPPVCVPELLFTIPLIPVIDELGEELVVVIVTFPCPALPLLSVPTFTPLLPNIVYSFPYTVSDLG